MNKTQGGKAQDSGKSGSLLISEAFKQKKFRIFTFTDYKSSDYNPMLDLWDPTPFVVVKEYPFITIAKTKGRIDYVLLKNDLPFLAIEVKTQNVQGSVDEKIAFMTMNAMESEFPLHYCAMIGNHWKYGRGSEYIKAMNNFIDKHNKSQKCKIMLFDEILNEIKNI